MRVQALETVQGSCFRVGNGKTKDSASLVWGVEGPWRMKASTWHWARSGCIVSGALIQSESCLVQVSSLGDNNPAEAPTTPRPGGSWESHLKHKSWLLWTRTPVEVPLCTLFYIFLLEWESKSLKCVPLFQDQDKKLWSSMPRTSSECWVKGKLFCVQTQCTWERSRIPHLKWQCFWSVCERVSRSEPSPCRHSIHCKPLRAKWGVLYWLIF